LVWTSTIGSLPSHTLRLPGRGLRPGVGEDCSGTGAAAGFRGASDLPLLAQVDADTASGVTALVKL
jgi:hypothetical protein